MPPTSLYQKKETTMQKNIIYLLIILSFTLILFIIPNEINTSILKACNLFINKIFPSLFPMFIITDLLIYLELPELLTKLFGNIFSKIFHTNPYGAFIFFTSLFAYHPCSPWLPVLACPASCAGVSLLRKLPRSRLFANSSSKIN